MAVVKDVKPLTPERIEQMIAATTPPSHELNRTYAEASYVQV